MAGLLERWRSRHRTAEEGDTTAAVNPGESSAGAGASQRESDLVLILQTLGTALRAVVRFTGRRVHQVQASRTLPWQEAVKKAQRANRRSLVLLLRLLNAEQRREFRTHGYFFVTGGRSGTRYRIRTDTIANIDVLDSDGRVDHRLCVGPAGDVPRYDVLAAQILHLQDAATEVALIQRANVLAALPQDRLHSRPMWLA